MSDDTRTTPDATTATDSTASTPGNTDDGGKVNLTQGELAELLRRAANDSASRTRRAIESDPKIGRAKRLAEIYDSALRDPEPVRAEPAKPAAPSRLEQMLEVLLASQIANLPKPPAPPAPEPVRPSDLIAHAQREATRGFQPGSPAFNEAIKGATAAALKKYRLKGG